MIDHLQRVHVLITNFICQLPVRMVSSCYGHTQIKNVWGPKYYILLYRQTLKTFWNGFGTFRNPVWKMALNAVLQYSLFIGILTSSQYGKCTKSNHRIANLNVSSKPVYLTLNSATISYLGSNPYQSSKTKENRKDWTKPDN